MIKSWRIVVILLLALAGAAISFHLTAIHVNHIKTGVPSSCNFNESFNCDAVNTSKWSELAGVPVAHLGMLAYLFMAGLGLSGLLSQRFRPHAHAYLFLISSWNLLFSLYMASIAMFVIKSVCVWCASLYGLNIVMLVFACKGGLGAAINSIEYVSEDLVLLKKPGWIVFALVCAGIIVGSSIWRRDDLKSAKALPPGPRITMNTAGSPFKGPENAPITIIEISDFECPFCRKASSTLDSVCNDYPGKVRVVFKHFPLDQACNPKILQPFHQKACIAARAAVCAADRGFFWPFSKKLFNGDLDPDSINVYATSLGFDPVEFKSCMDSLQTSTVISKDINDCISAGVQSIPVFLINGRKLVGAQSPEKFKAMIDEELASP